MKRIISILLLLTFLLSTASCSLIGSFSGQQTDIQTTEVSDPITTTEKTSKRIALTMDNYEDYLIVDDYREYAGTRLIEGHEYEYYYVEVTVRSVNTEYQFSNVKLIYQINERTRMEIRLDNTGSGSTHTNHSINTFYRYYYEITEVTGEVIVSEE